MPRQLHTRGDKLVFSNGILLLAGFAALLIFAFDADVTRLIQLYIIGVFTSFSIGQWGMVRHWNRELRTQQDPAERRRIRRSQAGSMRMASHLSLSVPVVSRPDLSVTAWPAARRRFVWRPLRGEHFPGEQGAAITTTAIAARPCRLRG